MEEPIGENASLLAALYRLVENEKPVLVRYPYVTDACHVASKISGSRSWVEALKRFATYPVAIASYQAPLVHDLDSLKTAVASVGAAFYRGALYGPVDVLDSSGTNTPPASFQSPTSPSRPTGTRLMLTSSGLRLPSRTALQSSWERTERSFRSLSSVPSSITTCISRRSPAGLSGTSLCRRPSSALKPRSPKPPDW